MSEYIEKLFNAEIAEKKRIARGEHNRVRSTKKCNLPSDYLTKSEKRRLNGAVINYDLSKPIKWADFIGMPVDLQKEYILGLRKRFYGVSNAEIAKMMGKAYYGFSKYLTQKLMIRRTCYTCNFCDSENYKNWLEFTGNSVDISDEIKIPDSDTSDIVGSILKLAKGKKVTITITLEV